MMNGTSLMRKLASILAIAVAIVLVQRAFTTPVGAQQAPDRTAAPKPGPAPSLKLPAIHKQTLSNGLPVWIVELHKVPVVNVSLSVRAGS